MMVTTKSWPRYRNMKIYISRIIVLLASILPGGRSTYAVPTREQTREITVPTTVEQIQELIAKEADAQLEMADKWRQLHELDTLDEKIKLAINCMRADPAMPISIYYTKIGGQLTKDAKSFLLKHREAALPHLLEFVEATTVYPRTERRIANVLDVLADIGMRETIVPLVRKLFALEKQAGWHSKSVLPKTLSRIGDQDLAGQLLSLYPYEDADIQTRIHYIISYAYLPDVVPTLIRETEAYFAINEPPPVSLVEALVGQADRRSRETLRKILSTFSETGDIDSPPWHGDLNLVVFRGLYELRENFNRFDLNLKQKIDLDFVKKYPYTLTRYAIRHRGPNHQLRDLIKKRIVQKKQALDESNITDSGLKLHLKVESDAVRAGEEVKFQAVITNLSEQLLKVMRCRQGSDLGYVMPKIQIDIWDPNDLPVLNCPINFSYYLDDDYRIKPQYGINPLKEDDIHELKPDGQFDIIIPPAFQPYKLRRFAKAQPGTYFIKMTYDTTGKARGAAIKRKEGQDPRFNDGTLPETVAPVRLVSNIFKIQVLPLPKIEDSPEKPDRTDDNRPFVSTRKKRR